MTLQPRIKKAPRADRAILRQNSNRFGGNHTVSCGRLGLVHVKVNGEIVHTIDDTTPIKLISLLRHALPLNSATDKVIIEVHNCTNTIYYQYDALEKVWTKHTETDGLF